MIILDPISVSAPGILVSSNVPENDAPAYSATRVFGAGEQAFDPSTHNLYESKVGSASAVMISIASPGVIAWPAHGLAAGTPISFDTSGALPGGLAANMVYYVVSPATNTFQVSATSGGTAIATSGSQSGVHRASAGDNFGRALTDKTYWEPAGATNRWKMFDSYNNTQTSRAEEIVVVVSPQAIVQALYLGNIEADDIVVTGTDPTDGQVYTETTSLIISNSASSMFNWLFKRIRRRRQFCTLQLPLYYAASFEIRIRKPGGIAKCGMFCIGPLEDVGLAEYGLEAEIKDYSTTNFNFDGTSETVVRGYSKQMSIDIEVNNDLVDEVHERMIDYRQKTVVFIGAKQFDLSLVCGVFSSFKTVVEGFTRSKISMQIQGKV